MTAAQAESTTTSPERSAPSLVARVGKLLLRLALVVLLGVVLGAGAYFGVTLGIRRLGEPARQNSARIAAVEAQLAEGGEFGQLRLQAGEQLAVTESRLDEQGGLIAELQAQLRDQGRAQDRMTSQLATLSDRLADLTKQIEEGAQEKQLRREVQLTRAMLSLVRARLWLVENNLGSAIAEVERARELLQPLAADQPQQANVRDALERLDFALVELNARPFIAADDIEIAWKLLAEPGGG